jgi:hypothetical protein
MRNSRRAVGFAAVVSACLGGCATEYTSGLRATDPYSAQSAYVYGRFAIDAESVALALDGHQSIGFSIRCRDGNRYVLRFSNQSPLQVIRVAPSVCQIDEIIYTSAGGTTLGRGRPPFRLFENETLVAGGVYYVGDFFAHATTKLSLTWFRSETRWSWEVTGVMDDYDRTTDQLKRWFPSFAPAATENRMTHGPNVL